jgi:hypothetical protein
MVIVGVWVMWDPGLGPPGPRTDVSGRLTDGATGAEGARPTRVAQPPVTPYYKMKSQRPR